MTGEELMKKIEKEEKWLFLALNKTDKTSAYSVDIAFDSVKHHVKDYIRTYEADKQCLKKQIDKLQDYIESLQKVGRWILVSEGLPEPYQRCLFTVEKPRWENEPVEYTVIAKAYGGEQNFIAWMPLPEPYEEAQE